MRRRRVFIFVSLIVSAIMLAGIVWMFTSKETAIATITRITEEILAPLTTPGP